MEFNRWGKWYFETCNIDGFRLDAVKHISSDFLTEWIDEMRTQCNKDFFMVAENWNVENVEELEEFIETTGGRTQLFDSLLHHNFYLASQSGKDYNLSSIFENTLVHRNPLLAVTFVDNHDSQPLQALDSFVEFWFRPLAYAMILLRQGGIPCVFYTDVYGAKYEDKEQKIELVALPELPTLLKVREDLAYGEQRDYLDHRNCIGWTRGGDEDHPNSGLAILMSNGDEGFKEMKVGEKFMGKVFIDILGKRTEEVMINENGCGEFFCEAGSVSVWIVKV